MSQGPSCRCPHDEGVLGKEETGGRSKQCLQRLKGETSRTGWAYGATQSMAWPNGGVLGEGRRELGMAWIAQG